MKAKIHPKYHKKAKAACSCGVKFEVGSTEEKLEVEVCSSCHPFYTGKQKLADVAGRIDKFKKRLSQAEKADKNKKIKKERKKTRKDTTVKL
ncbi:MAG: 50S ribosomal protein L31 [bacterium]